MANYIALIRKEEGTCFGVDFPDLPGCTSAGDTLDQARHMAAEALALHIEAMRADGDPIPEPSSLEAIMADEFNRGAVAVPVPAPVGAPTTVIRRR